MCRNNGKSGERGETHEWPYTGPSGYMRKLTKNRGMEGHITGRKRRPKLMARFKARLRYATDPSYHSETCRWARILRRVR